MLQKELSKRLRARYDTKMDGNGWLEVSSDGIPLCRIKYNGQYLSNADQNLSDEYRSKIADIQEEISTVREYVGLYEHAPQMKADGVSDYRQLAAFGDTVLAATYSEKNGFMFCTPRRKRGRRNMPNIAALITVAAVMFAVLGAITLIAHIYNLNNIKSKTVGDGQHGTARWANKTEIRKTYRHIPFTPKKWRKQAKQNQTPTMTAIAPRKLLQKKTEPTEEALPQGIVVGCKGGKHSTTAMIDTGDVHVLMIGAAGVGKTAF